MSTVQHGRPVDVLTYIREMERGAERGTGAPPSPEETSGDFKWREDVLEEIVPYRDRFDRWAHPTQHTARTALMLVPGLLEQFRHRRVPEEMTSIDLNADGYSAVQIACRCGEVHEVEIGGLSGAPCGRYFAWFGRSVMWAMPEDDGGPPCICRTDAAGYEFLNRDCPLCCPAKSAD